jgi:hypothetical protein
MLAADFYFWFLQALRRNANFSFANLGANFIKRYTNKSYYYYYYD